MSDEERMVRRVDACSSTQPFLTRVVIAVVPTVILGVPGRWFQIWMDKVRRLGVRWSTFATGVLVVVAFLRRWPIVYQVDYE